MVWTFAQLCEAVTLSLPAYRTGTLQTQFPVPFSGTWYPGLGIEVSASQLLVLIVVPVITVALWWVLGHTAFGDSVRAAASNSDLARMTGINLQDEFAQVVTTAAACTPVE